MRESDELPGYELDERGYYSDTPDGRFRPIDFYLGHIVVMEPLWRMRVRQRRQLAQVMPDSAVSRGGFHFNGET